MINKSVTFDLPIWVAKGVATGKYTRIGGVVRNGAGQIVCMLRESGSAPRAIQAASKVGFVGLGLAAVAGVGFLSFKLYSKKGQLERRVHSLQRNTIRYSIAASEGGLTSNDLDQVSKAVNQVLDFMQISGLDLNQIGLDKDTVSKMRQFLQSLVDFNQKLALSESRLEAPPVPEENDSLSELLQDIDQQIGFQRPLFDSSETTPLH